MNSYVFYENKQLQHSFGGKISYKPRGGWVKWVALNMENWTPHKSNQVQKASPDEFVGDINQQWCAI